MDKWPFSMPPNYRIDEEFEPMPFASANVEARAVLVLRRFELRMKKRLFRRPVLQYRWVEVARANTLDSRASQELFLRKTAQLMEEAEAL